jgi:hypothetical protein
MNLRRRIRRLVYLWKIFRDTGSELNRRVDVENRLWAAYSGKKPLPDREECKRLALKLGIPDWYKDR